MGSGHSSDRNGVVDLVKWMQNVSEIEREKGWDLFVAKLDGNIGVIELGNIEVYGSSTVWFLKKCLEYIKSLFISNIREAWVLAIMIQIFTQISMKIGKIPDDVVNNCDFMEILVKIMKDLLHYEIIEILFIINKAFLDLSNGINILSDNMYDKILLSFPIQSFPYNDYLKFLFEQSSLYLVNKSTNIGLFLQTSFVILSQNSIENEYYAAILREIDHRVILSGFLGQMSLFSPYYPIAIESLTFFYSIISKNMNFCCTVSSLNRTYTFVYDLLNLMQFHYENNGISYIHTIILSALMLLLADTKGAMCLNLPVEKHFECKQRFHRGNLADFLIEVMYQFFKEKSLIESISCLLHFISPYIVEFNAISCVKIFQMFDFISEFDTENQIRRLFYEMFSFFVAQRPIENYNLLILLTKKRSCFKNNNDPHSLVINSFIKTIKSTMKLLGIPILSYSTASRVFKEIEKKNELQTSPPFVFHPHVFTGEMKKKWPIWCNLLYQRLVKKT